uniref:Uncharacterized protein n=1 Tax=Anguilla anguilla TaxID=7936 RepID=A0A0E9RU66_ANGAN
MVFDLEMIKSVTSNDTIIPYHTWKHNIMMIITVIIIKLLLFYCLHHLKTRKLQMLHELQNCE